MYIALNIFVEGNNMEKKIYHLQNYFKKTFNPIITSSIVGIILFPALAYADNGGFQLTTILQQFISLLNSDIARLLFVIAIIGVGYGWLYMGRIPKSRALGAIIGIGIVFSASYLGQRLIGA